MDEYVVVARRKGSEWYVGAIGNHSARDIVLPLDFLGDGEYAMELYSDAEDTDTDPNHLEKNQRQVTKGDSLEVRLANSGGFAARLVPVAK